MLCIWVLGFSLSHQKHLLPVYYGLGTAWEVGWECGQ